MKFTNIAMCLVSGLLMMIVFLLNQKMIMNLTISSLTAVEDNDSDKTPNKGELDDNNNSSRDAVRIPLQIDEYQLILHRAKLTIIFYQLHMNPTYSPTSVDLWTQIGHWAKVDSKDAIFMCSSSLFKNIVGI